MYLKRFIIFMIYQVQSAGSNDGPVGVEVKLESDTDVRTVLTGRRGAFFFTPVYPGNYKVSASHPRYCYYFLLKTSFTVNT